ncbi:mandelate racemase/muconate lactonizing enzyme family protein [Arthrobacter sp. CG_A4]|uniref:mandelate racemase/muconate lactonizing enzyme family protein n=1 Tax=Arthrobacter sp. CG_A4 TaxID=3071706 RepID=UPI002E0AA0E2|nr:L-alanine-DL-glutamate epimerase-like enolase superfamily enzyme [Arthrobacter sp. CG_A4]
MTTPAAALTGLRVHRVRVPLVGHFTTAVRSATELETVLVEAIDSEGRSGWGEAPISRVTRLSTEQAVASIEGPLAALVLGRSSRRAGITTAGITTAGSTTAGSTTAGIATPGGLPSGGLPGELDGVLARLEQSSEPAAARMAVDCALHDLAAQQRGLTLAAYLAGTGTAVQAPGDGARGIVRGAAGIPMTVETDMTLSVAPPAELAAKAAAHAAAGFRCLKVKLDGQMDVLASIRAVREAAGPDMVLRVDANQAFDAGTAIRLIRTLEDAGLGIELAEQPVPAGDWAGLAAVSAAVDTPIMADESVWTLADLDRLLAHRAAAMVNIKLAKTGGLFHARRLLGRSRAEGLGVVIGCMLESPVGIAAAASLAALIPSLTDQSTGRSTAQDLDGGLWLAASPVAGGASYEGRTIRLATAPGLGISGLS